MSAQIAFNPLVTTNGAGSFNVQSDGYIQGQAMDDPSARYRLAGGVLADSETIPMWGGVAISETTSPYSGGSANGVNGGKITRATQIADTENPPDGGDAGDLTGFSVFDQDHSMINTPQSPVPLAASGMTVNFYRLGSNARIALAIDPALVDLEGNIITQAVSWDFTNQRLVPYIASALTISSGTYVDGTGVVTLTMSAPITFGPGDSITVSSLTGTGAFASLNGTFTALAGTTGSTVVYNAGSGLGASTITGGSLLVGGAAAAILPVKILNVQIGNSMVVSYDPVTGFATWNRSGSCALVQI
jgi:hypothetical protein